MIDIILFLFINNNELEDKRSFKHDNHHQINLYKLNAAVKFAFFVYYFLVFDINNMFINL